MHTNKVLEIRCTNPNCKTWFPSPFTHGNLNGFNVNVFIGLKAQCLICGKMVSGTIKNVRIRTVSDNLRFDKTS
ncbi:hypothetical protein [Heyndrickxia sporothermodurans]|uniref:hypothetical protein n=1 Tax=Heyndrickxia sporothermodurans TaxID=46224 RepID=UPI0008260D85|nr:hypothetical protein [Heyndrickxia sporothermodurans]